MWLLARLESEPEAGERRSSQRRKLHLETHGLSAAARSQVVIHDLSADGFLMESSASIEVGDRLEVGIPEAGSVEATAVWKSGRYSGCKFSEPLSTAAVSAAELRSHPSPPQASPSETLSEALVELETLSNEIRRITFMVDRALTRLSKRDKNKPD